MPKVLDLPEVKVGRSIFPREFRQITTFNTGDIIPLMYDCNITPGDTVKIPIKAIVRMQTPIYPVADDLVLDVSAWFVPDRLNWVHFKEFWGENNTTFWEQPTKYEIPQIEAPQGGWTTGSLADYFGIPTGVDGISVSQMPGRAYSLIWNEFWRDENLKEPIFFNTDETTLVGKNVDANYDYTTYTQLLAAPMKAAKRGDYFTKALPSPQKASDIFIPLGDKAPVVLDSSNTVGSAQYPVDNTYDGEYYQFLKNPSNNVFYPGANNGTTGTDLPSGKNYGLAADLSNALGATVNQLRTAIALQRYAETIARSGWAKA